MTEGEAGERLFVPLKTEYWRLFREGVKTWELRGVNSQFNPDTVWRGRTVELRRGYNTDDSLWGNIKDRETYDSLKEIHPKRARTINPSLSHEEFVDGAKKMLGSYERYIAFEVALDQEDQV